MVPLADRNYKKTISMVQGCRAGMGISRFWIIPVCMILLFTGTAHAQLFQVEIERGERVTSGGDTIGYDLFVPKPWADAPSPPWPGVVIIPGYGRDRNHHRKNAYFLAQAGMIVLTPSPVTLFSGEPAQFRNIANTVDHSSWLKGRSAKSGDRLAGLIDPDRIGLAGHSAGGAIAFEAAIEAQASSAAIHALCLLDAVPWDRTLERAGALEPLAFASFRSSTSICNGWGRVVSLLERLTFPCEDVQIVGASHCDPENSSMALCSLLCGRGGRKQRALYQNLMFLFFCEAFGMTSHKHNGENLKMALEGLEKRGDVKRKIVGGTNGPR